MDVRQIFQENLKQAIESRGITQSDIAIAVGVTTATVSDWVKGKKYPRPDKMQRIADLLHVSMSWLTTGNAIRGGTTSFPRMDELIDICGQMTPAAVDRVIAYAQDLAANPTNRKL